MRGRHHRVVIEWDDGRRVPTARNGRTRRPRDGRRRRRHAPVRERAGDVRAAERGRGEQAAEPDLAMVVDDRGRRVAVCVRRAR